MSQAMPQEIEVWFLLPAIRRELVKIFTKKFSMSQREAASLLGLTESAISQYVKDKRGAELEFSTKDKKRVEKTAKEIKAHPDKTVQLIYALSVDLRGTKNICDLHRKQDGSIPRDCKLCR